MRLGLFNARHIHNGGGVRAQFSTKHTPQKFGVGAVGCGTAVVFRIDDNSFGFVLPLLQGNNGYFYCMLTCRKMSFFDKINNKNNYNYQK